MAYGEKIFWLHSFPSGSTVSRYDTLKQVEKTLGSPHPDLEVPDLDPLVLETWNAYIDIKSGVDRISFLEIKAYTELVRLLDPWEVKAIKRLETARNRSYG